MLNSLEIRNYRNLKHLRIEKLGRVNLVIGKNNTGKSSLLEAVAIKVSDNPWRTIKAVLADRGEQLNPKSIEIESEAIESFGSLFTNNSLDYWDWESNIFIGEEGNALAFRVVKTYDDAEKRQTLIAEDEDEIRGKLHEQNLAIFSTNKKNNFQIHPLMISIDGIDLLTKISRDYFQYVGTSLNKRFNSNLWNKISLTPLEIKVIDALKIIDVEIEELNFSSTGEAYIRKGNNKLPLRRMGDGINRILTIILAMVNCENGYLLIDEFENGLHYSVQEKLWEIIFQQAERLNIQVFVTTHSNDTIRSFTKISNEKPSEGYLIKLRNINGEIDAVVFNEEELQTAAEAEYLDLRL